MELKQQLEKKKWEEWARENSDPSQVRRKDEALGKFLVLDLSYGNFAGLFCSSTLAEFGARVVRIEPPDGDVARRFSPFGLKVKDTGLAYLAEARNKHHITLNLETAQGRQILKSLANKADILVETYPAGTMDAMGLGYRALSETNPSLVYAAINTFGQYGSDAGKFKASSDVVAQARSGLAYFNGYPENGGPSDSAVPTKHGNWMAWYAGGGFATFAVLAALHHRKRSGKGQFIDVSEGEALMRFCDYNCLWFHTLGKIRERVGNFDPAVFPYTYVKTKDGFAFLAGFSDINWHALTSITENPALEKRFPTIFDRLNYENEKEIFKALEEWSQNYTSQEILAKIQEYDRTVGKGVVATGRVNDPLDTMNEANWWERGALKKIIDPVYGEIVLQMPPWKMTETPPRVKTVCKPIGADNDYIFMKYLGFGNTHLKQLKQEGVI